MSTNEQLPEKLSQAWATVRNESGRAIEWINAVRGNARSVDVEGDSLTFKLRQVRNQAKRLAVASALPSTVGFFGLSQAGKSYLICALAAGMDGALETEVDGKRLDFIKHINPPGGGKEATGLVTRFSRRATQGPRGFPIELKLLAEIEIAKIFVNSYFNDFDFEKIGTRVDIDKARGKLVELELRKQAQRVSEIDEDDLVSLWDYLKTLASGSAGVLEADFLPRAVAIAPFLKIEDRAQLYSCLWGQVPALTSAFLDLGKALVALGSPDKVFAPIDALVRPTGHEGALSQADSIMNVDILERLGSVQDTRIEVLPVVSSDIKGIQSVSLVQLAALTAEMIFPLVNTPAQSLFEEVDLLDFPGYRGRLKLESLADLSSGKAGERANNPVAQLFLRGKVAYLFERYTDSQEMNVLVVCTASHKQSDVNDVGPVLTEWISKTQGRTAEQRSKRLPGLLWAITMFDIKIVDSLSKDKDMLDTVWANLIKFTMLERFNSCNWMQDWSGGHAFNNTFLVRKPRLPVAFLEIADDKELAVRPALEPALGLMQATFVAADLVRTHVSHPAESWQAMMRLNDGGVARISDYLSRVSPSELKLARIAEQLNEEVLHDLLENRLGRWFHQDGVGELDAKRKVAQQVITGLQPRIRLLGELQSRLQLSDPLLQGLYMRADAEPEISARSADSEGPAALDLGDDLFGLNDSFDIFAEKPKKVPEATARVGGSDSRFSQAVLREWFKHLRSMSEDAQLVTYFGVPKYAIEMLSNELITAASRLDLQAQLLQRISVTEQVGTRREQLVDRQVLAAKTVLADFIAWLGYISVAADKRPDSRVNKGKKLFEHPPRIPRGQLPDIGVQPVEHTKIYMGDWLVGLAQLIVDNAGHDVGREITLLQNSELGSIIHRFETAKINPE